jgi:hypothetical protein
MDTFTFMPTAPISHNVEMYTERFMVQGIIVGPFKRTSDLMNHRENTYIAVEQAIISPVGQQPESESGSETMTTPVMLNKDHLHIVTIAPYAPAGQPSGPLTSGPLASPPQMPTMSSREMFVQKNSFLCYALTDTFVIHGYCHLRQDTNLQVLLEIGEPFLPITNPTISLLARPNAPWKRDLVLLNKANIEVMYLAEE